MAKTTTTTTIVPNEGLIHGFHNIAKRHFLPFVKLGDTAWLDVGGHKLQKKNITRGTSSRRTVPVPTTIAEQITWPEGDETEVTSLAVTKRAETGVEEVHGIPVRDIIPTKEMRAKYPEASLLDRAQWTRSQRTTKPLNVTISPPLNLLSTEDLKALDERTNRRTIHFEVDNEL